MSYLIKIDIIVLAIVLFYIIVFTIFQDYIIVYTIVSGLYKCLYRIVLIYIIVFAYILVFTILSGLYSNGKVPAIVLFYINIVNPQEGTVWYTR